MYLIILCVTSFIANTILTYFLIKQNNELKELEIKLKITTDYANTQAAKTLKVKAANDKPLQAIKDERLFLNHNKLTTSPEVEGEIKKQTRRRKKKSNNNNA